MKDLRSEFVLGQKVTDRVMGPNLTGRIYSIKRDRVGIRWSEGSTATYVNKDALTELIKS